MFFPGSRYANLVSYRPNGTTVSATRLPLPVQGPLLGFHPRVSGQRLDLIASHYLKAPTAFWRLCDANNSVVPDALATRRLVGIPR